MLSVLFLIICATQRAYAQTILVPIGGNNNRNNNIREQLDALSAKSALCKCEVERDEYCCGNHEYWVDYFSLCDAKCNGEDEVNCKKGTCLANNKVYVAASTVKNPMASPAFGAPLQYLSSRIWTHVSKQWDGLDSPISYVLMMQIGLFAACCLALGLSIGCCANRQAEKAMSYGSEEDKIVYKL